MPQEEKKQTQELERIYTLNLSKAFLSPRKKRAIRAIKILKKQLARHFKLDIENIKLSNALNAKVFSHSIEKPPKKLKIRGILKEGKLFAYLFEENISKAQEQKQQKEKKQKENKEKDKKDQSATQSKAKEEESKTNLKQQSKSANLNQTLTQNKPSSEQAQVGGQTQPKAQNSAKG